MNWSQIINGILPLLGVIIGSLTTYFTQMQNLNKKLKREIEKEKEERKIECLKVYSEILKLDGEKMMQEHVGGDRVDFNLRVFTSQFRPIFYSKFYLLDELIADKIRRMDNIIIVSSFYDEFNRAENDQLIILYNEIIEEIENQLKSYRV